MLISRINQNFYHKTRYLLKQLKEILTVMHWNFLLCHFIKITSYHPNSRELLHRGLRYSKCVVPVSSRGTFLHYINPSIPILPHFCKTGFVSSIRKFWRDKRDFTSMSFLSTQWDYNFRKCLKCFKPHCTMFYSNT